MTHLEPTDHKFDHSINIVLQRFQEVSYSIWNDSSFLSKRSGNSYTLENILFHSKDGMLSCRRPSKALQ